MPLKPYPFNCDVLSTWPTKRARRNPAPRRALHPSRARVNPRPNHFGTSSASPLQYT